MNKSTKVRLVALSAKLTKKVTEFAQNPDDENHTARNVAVGAGALAAGYGGLSYLRGRKALDNFRGYGDNSFKGTLEAIRTGHNMNVASAASAIAPAAAAVRGASGTVGSAIGNAAGAVANKATSIGRSSKAAALIALRRAKQAV